MGIFGNLLGIGNKILDKFSNEERRRRRRNAIQKLREKRARVAFDENLSSAKRSKLLNAIDDKMQLLENQASNE